ncbi:MAG: DUF2889 domain-containing protein [Proteobacteria bacterium]|nr:DUF2889 domain-containing protein [Pseudomonadota bacterium]
MQGLKKERLNSRTISVNCFLSEDDKILVEGTLTDQRHVEVIGRLGETMEPGPVHTMVVRLLVGEVPPRILDAEAEMQETPMEECKEVEESIKKLIGIPVIYGFTGEVKRRLGKTEGCLHLVALTNAMGPVALHGWNNQNRRSSMPAEVSASVIEYIKDSCWVWREGGGQYEKALKEIEEAETRKLQ